MVVNINHDKYVKNYSKHHGKFIKRTTNDISVDVPSIRNWIPITEIRILKNNKIMYRHKDDNNWVDKTYDSIIEYTNADKNGDKKNCALFKDFSANKEECSKLLTHCLQGKDINACIEFFSSDFYKNVAQEIMNISLEKIATLLDTLQFTITTTDQYVDRNRTIPYKRYINFDEWINTNNNIRNKDKENIQKNEKLKYYLNNLVNKINDSTFPTTRDLSQEQADKLFQNATIKTKSMSNLSVNGLNVQGGGKLVNNLANSLLDFENILDDNIYQYNVLNKYINQIGGNNMDNLINSISLLDQDSMFVNRLQQHSNKRMSVIIRNIYDNILKNLSDKNIHINEQDKQLIDEKIFKLEEDETKLMENLKILGKYTLLILSGDKNNDHSYEKMKMLVGQSTDKINSIMKKTSKLKDAMNYTVKLIIPPSINPLSRIVNSYQRY